MRDNPIEMRKTAQPLLATSAFAALMMIAGTAPAAEGDRSYAWQTLAVDGTAIALIVTGVATTPRSWTHATFLTLALDSERQPAPVTDIGVGLFLLGTPIVHALHERWVPSVASLSIRAAAPSIGIITFGGAGVIAALIVGDCGLLRGCRNDTAAEIMFGSGMALGYLIGYGAPVLIDALVFAREPAPRPSTPASTTMFAPRFQLMPGGFAGSF